MEDDISNEDRVEIYFSKSDSLSEYFCIEVDPYGRVLDYKAQFYRIFDSEWNADDQLIVDSEITNDGYNIAIIIPLKTLVTQMGIDIFEYFYVGLFRAELHIKNGKIIENWISWVNPLTKHPDYHIPEAFGIFYLSK